MISEINEFICKKCMILKQYNNMDINEEKGLNAGIGRAIVYCLNNSINNDEGIVVETDNTCEWRGSLDSFIQHNNECKITSIICKYCNNSNNKILRKNINEHYNICNEYPIKCKNTGCNKLIKRKNMDNHCLNECEYELITCKNSGCDIVMTRNECSIHENECPKRIVYCTFSKHGCRVPVILDEITKHMQEYAIKHCEYLQNTLVNQEQIALRNISDLEAKCHDKEITIAKLQIIAEKKDNELARANDECLNLKTANKELEILKTRMEEIQNIHDKYGFKIFKDERIVLKSQKINEYCNIILNGKSVLTTVEYKSDTKNGGLLILTIKNNLVLNDNSEINLSGYGFKGGDFGTQGFSYKGKGIKSRENNYGGGGSKFNESKCYGAGGGYGTKGQSSNNAKGGDVYGNYKLDVLYLGSGGGGSGLNKGGNGGGSIKIECNKLIINKNCGIYCNGNYGNGFSGCGSGGSIYIICNELINYGNIHAKGGKSEFGNGGYGRIRIDCNKITNKGNIRPDIGYNIYNNWW